MSHKRIAMLVGGSDLFSGMRGISKGTKLIKGAIAPHFDEVIAVNYNYFLDFGQALRRLQRYFSNMPSGTAIVLYGYSKGGDVVLQLARWLKHKYPVQLLITIDVANGPWFTASTARFPPM
ncbi:hypothetical protein [Foetidibacter luteolus]|uniref:hypothetical protein n=1 Tax=Foetidibacter luteolus TaxID=2608880 RepID=UPI00129BBE69|nr:hypothetical protein [Foetidibacter luteolus]